MKMESFHVAISPIISCAQLFGVMPLKGLSSKNLSNLSFCWNSMRLLGSVIFLFLNFTVVISFALYFNEIGFTAKNMVSLIFFGTSFAAYFLFLLLARRWPCIIQYWAKEEAKFLSEKYFMKNLQLARTIKAISTGIALLALGEHVMYQLSTIYSFNMKLITCNITLDNPVESYYRKEYPCIYNILPYHHILSIIMQVLSLASTFVWNFMDLFIILVSVGLAARFKQLCNRLWKRFLLYVNFNTTIQQYGNQTEGFFHEIRLDFITMLNLLSYVDKEISFIILLSCLNNLYFICYQLMNIFNALRYFINYAYYWYSLLYLIGRTAFLFIAAASINEAARMPARVLENVPGHIWCEELIAAMGLIFFVFDNIQWKFIFWFGLFMVTFVAHRFLYQVNSETIGLTAMGFFYFTRELVLTMTGTIITFEMVIVQFDRSSNDYKLPPLCD